MQPKDRSNLQTSNAMWGNLKSDFDIVGWTSCLIGPRRRESTKTSSFPGNYEEAQDFKQRGTHTRSAATSKGQRDDASLPGNQTGAMSPSKYQLLLTCGSHILGELNRISGIHKAISKLSLFIEDFMCIHIKYIYIQCTYIIHVHTCKNILMCVEAT